MNNKVNVNVNVVDARVNVGLPLDEVFRSVAESIIWGKNPVRGCGWIPESQLQHVIQQVRDEYYRLKTEQQSKMKPDSKQLAESTSEVVNESELTSKHSSKNSSPKIPGSENGKQPE